VETTSGTWKQSGRELSAREIGQIRETVAWLPGLARKELAATICEHLDWRTAAGTPKIQACQALLERLEAAGVLELPVPRRRKNAGGPRADVVPGERTAGERALACPLREARPIRLEVATGADEVGLWNEYVERFHPLGYKGAFGYRLRYFVRSGAQPLGCILLGGAAKAIAVRDHWIGWDERTRLRNLPWVVNNTRFLIFPHVLSVTLSHRRFPKIFLGRTGKTSRIAGPGEAALADGAKRKAARMIDAGVRGGKESAVGSGRRAGVRRQGVRRGARRRDRTGRAVLCPPGSGWVR
jgi:hypothetical protein